MRDDQIGYCKFKLLYDHDGGGAGPLQCLGGVLSIMVTMPWPRSQS